MSSLLAANGSSGTASLLHHLFLTVRVHMSSQSEPRLLKVVTTNSRRQHKAVVAIESRVDKDQRLADRCKEQITRAVRHADMAEQLLGQVQRQLCRWALR